MKNLKVIFMGTPQFAVPVLEMLNKETDVVLVVTKPDMKVGRKQILSFSPVKEYAVKHNIPVFTPKKIKEEKDTILNTPCDIIITCAYGQILPEKILEYPKYKCVNVHASLLPKYRGGAPIHWCLINGEKETGVTIMYMDKLMDNGDIIAQESYQIKDSDNVSTLHEKLSLIGRDLLLKVLPDIINHKVKPKHQDETKVTYALNIKREDEHLNFQDKGINIINKIRGLNSFPLANITFNGEEMKVLEAYFAPKDNVEPEKVVEVTKDSLGITCQDGIIYLTKIKPFGKKVMMIKDYLNGVDKEKIKKGIIK